MKLRISESQWTTLCRQLMTRKDVESAGLLLAEPIPNTNGKVLAVREAFALTDAAYRVRRRDQISLDPVALNRLTRRARENRWSVFTIHTHPGSTEAWFSEADDAGDERFMPSMRSQIPGAPHGSIVLAEGGKALARAFDGTGAGRPIELHVVGRTLQSVEATTENTGAVDVRFSRQEVALGARGQQRLRRLRVAVVGLGGIGSVVCLQLAHLGVGSLVLVDGDLVEASNLSRIVGATKDDIGRKKVDVAARYAESTGLVHLVERCSEFASADHLALLSSCDVIMCCVDRQTPRALLNRLAYRALVPVIDLGTVFRANERQEIVEDAGRVVVVGPGRPCLGCWGHLDAQALRIEALSPAEREDEANAGYIEGVVEAQPSVIAFNTFVAGAGVAELVRLTTAFAGCDAPPLRLAFSFSQGTVRRNVLAGDTRCEICGAGPTAAEKQYAQLVQS